MEDTDGRALGEEFIWSFRTGGPIVRVSVGAAGNEGDGCSFDPSLSEGGGLIAFESLAGNLVDGDAPGPPDAMRKDTQSGRVTLVNADEDGVAADISAPSSPPCSPPTAATPFPSQFTAATDNLVPADTAGVTDVFVKAIVSGAINRISVARTSR